MGVVSAGLLLWRRRDGRLEVLLVHPGGPFWAKRDLGAWSIPKGLVGAGEEPLAAARREVAEETGASLDVGAAIALGSLRQPGGKTVVAWALAADLDAGAIRSDTFEIEWPPRSGKRREFPEVDRAEWFARDEAARRILPGQRAFLDALDRALDGR
jgi:predicted NUDIX family NTP pyrophosphohydrolase